MGLVVKLKPLQRVYFNEGYCLEVSKDGGQFTLHFIGKKPFPFDVKRESLTLFKDRMKSRGSNEAGDKVRNMQQKRQPKGTK